MKRKKQEIGVLDNHLSEKMIRRTLQRPHMYVPLSEICHPILVLEVNHILAARHVLVVHHRLPEVHRHPVQTIGLTMREWTRIIRHIRDILPLQKLTHLRAHIARVQGLLRQLEEDIIVQIIITYHPQLQ